MARLIPLAQPLTGTATDTRLPAFSPAGSSVSTVAPGRAVAHPNPRFSPLPRALPSATGPTSTSSPRSGSHGSTTPPCVPMALVAGYAFSNPYDIDRTGSAMGTNGRASMKGRRIYDHLTPLEGITTTERDGWTICPSRTAPLRIVPRSPVADSGPDPKVLQHPALLNIEQKEVPEMQTPHPMDEEILSMHDTRAAAIRLFSRDGVIDADERYVLDRIDGHRSFFSLYRLREIAAFSWLRNGASRLTRRRFNDAGFELHLVETPADNIIPFPVSELQKA